MEIVCPIDNKDDAIQKISSIVSSGTASGSFSGPTGGAVNVDGKWGYSGGYTTLHGSTITDLARKLSPPEQPKLEGLGCLWIPIIYPGVILAFTWPISLMVTIIGDSDVNKTTFNLMLLVTGAIGIFSGLSYLKHFRFLDQKKKDESKIKIQKWEISFRKWDELYYCFKHDVIFNPSNKEIIKESDLINYCGF